MKGLPTEVITYKEVGRTQMQDVIDSSQVFIHQVQTYIINKVTQTYSRKPETGNHLTNRSAGARNVEQEQQHPLNIQQAVNKE